MRWIREHGNLVLTVTSFTAFVIATAFGTAHLSGAEVGSAADLLAAYATLAAFAAAGFAVYFSHQAYRIEEGRDKARLRAERRAQAELVAAWPGEIQFGREHNHGVVGRPIEINGATALLRNASSVPVWNVAVEFVIIRLPTTEGGSPDGQARKAIRRLSVLPPTDTPITVDCPDFEPIPYTGPDTQETVQKQMLCRLWFTDSRNRRWLRDEQGRLSRHRS